MKKIFKKSIVVLIMLSMLFFVACDSKSAAPTFKTGSFDGMVFTNEWANMKFTFPEDSVVASQDEINEIMKQGNSMLYSDDKKMEEALNKAADLKLAYDFLISSPDNTTNYQLFYENLALSVGGTKYTEKEYLDVALEPVLANKELGYEILDEGTKVIADKEFYYYTLSGYGGVVIQNMYCFKLDNRMIVFTTTYTPENEKSVSEVIDNITVAK